MSIRDVPSFTEMESLALRAYFVAWKEATSFFDWIEDTGALSFSVENYKIIPEAGFENEPSLELSAENLQAYEKAMQPRLQLVFSLIQHSQELALGAHICKESPYLLFAGVDPKSWAKDTVFSELRTIDADDLVRVNRAIGTLKLSESFQQCIERIRRSRNLIQHLGRHKPIELLEPIKILVEQYVELFPNRNGIQDLFASEDIGLDEIFYTSDTARMHAMYQLSMLHRFAPKNAAKKVLRIDPTSAIYECAECISESDFDHQGHFVGSIERRKGSLTCKCKFCERDFILKKKKCTKCQCDVVFAEGENEGRCCSCEN